MPNQTKKISNVKKTRVNTRTKTATSSEADGVFFSKARALHDLGVNVGQSNASGLTEPAIASRSRYWAALCYA